MNISMTSAATFEPRNAETTEIAARIDAVHALTSASEFIAWAIRDILTGGDEAAEALQWAMAQIGETVWHILDEDEDDTEAREAVRRTLSRIAKAS